MKGETAPSGGESRTLAVLRRAVLALVVIGSVGTGVELLLLEHTESAWQIVPVILLGLGVVAALMHLLYPRVPTLSKSSDR